MKEPKFEWDENTGFASCTIYYKNMEFCGIASCHDIDIDMKSEKTGCTIALLRAEIEYYIYTKKEITSQLNILKTLYGNMKTSKKFNIHSYEAKCIRREIYRVKEDLRVATDLLKDKRAELHSFITSKDEMYQKIRKMREGQN